MRTTGYWRRLNLWPRLVIGVTVTFGAFFAVFSVFALQAIDDSTGRVLGERLVIARMAARELDRTLRREAQALSGPQAPARLAAAAPVPSTRVALERARRSLASPSLALYLLRADGRTLAAAARAGDAAPLLRYGRLAIARRRMVVSQPFRDATGRAAIALAVPLFDAREQLRSVLVDVLDAGAPEFVAPLRQAMRLGSTGHGELVGPGGIVIASTEPGDALRPGEHLPFYRKMLASPRDGVEDVLYTPWDAATAPQPASRHVMAFARLRAAPWGVAVGGTDTETLASVRKLRRMLLFTGSGSLAGLWLLALLGARLLVRPVRGLTNAAKEMAAGDLDSRVHVREGGEIGALGDSLETMRAQLRASLETVRRWGEELEDRVGERTAELRERNRQLAAVTAVATAANEAVDLTRMLDACLAAILEHSGMDGASIRLVDPRTNELVPAAAAGSHLDLSCSRTPVRSTACACVVAASREQPLYLEPRQDGGFGPACPARSESLVVLPLRTPKAIIGVLALTGTCSPLPLESERPTLLAICDQLAVAIENARLVEEMGRVEAQREVQRMRDQLISSVSHELRTPLAVIKSYATTLLREQRSGDADTRRQFLEIIDDETGRLDSMIDELLDVSRLHAGTLKIDTAPVDLAALVAASAEKMRPLLERERHTLELTLPHEQIEVVADAVRIEQVIDNLLENASRYSETGTAIGLAVGADDADALLAVRDHGPGIPEHEREHVFDPFYRGEIARRLRTKGVGLGLSICRGIVEAHGGTIAVEPSPGGGSTFLVTLPLATAAAQRA